MFQVPSRRRRSRKVGCETWTSRRSISPWAIFRASNCICNQGMRSATNGRPSTFCRRKTSRRTSSPASGLIFT